jgi:hypothetical protein
MTSSIEAANNASNDAPESDENTAIKEPRLWRDDGWTAKVVKNQDDEGWAVEMYLDGQAEPALVGPWTMGRDKKNPKPLDVSAFHTLIKTASEVITRHEQALHASLNKTVTVDTEDARWTVALKIVPDEDDPYGLLSAENAFGERVEAVRVRADFKLNMASATAWVADEFRKSR